MLPMILQQGCGFIRETAPCGMNFETRKDVNVFTFRLNKRTCWNGPG